MAKLSRIIIQITDYYKNEAFPLMKCIRRYLEWADDHFGLSLT